MYRYIWGIVKNKNCILFRINGVEDHLHLPTDLHPTLALADFVKDIKVGSSLWMKESGLFPEFEGWSEGYGAFTYSIRERDKIINYIKNQKEHHKKESFLGEYKALLDEHGVEYDEKYIFTMLKLPPKTSPNSCLPTPMNKPSKPLSRKN